MAFWFNSSKDSKILIPSSQAGFGEEESYADFSDFEGTVYLVWRFYQSFIAKIIECMEDNVQSSKEHEQILNFGSVFSFFFGPM